MNELTFLQAKKSKVDILEMLKVHDLKFDISCDHELMRYVITLMKKVNSRMSVLRSGQMKIPRSSMTMTSTVSRVKIILYNERMVFAMKENIIDALEKMKASIKDIDTNIKMIDVLLSSINASIDELPMELQESIMTLIKQRQELICHRIEGLRLIKLTEELISGE